jgi:hypothetical protein
MKLSIEKGRLLSLSPSLCASFHIPGILHNHMNTLLLNIELLQGLYEPHAMILDKNLVDRLMGRFSLDFTLMAEISLFSAQQLLAPFDSATAPALVRSTTLVT